MFLRSSIVLALVSALVMGLSASAAVVPGVSLHAEKIVAAFNGSNGGKGVIFDYVNNPLGRVSQKFNDAAGTFYDFADTSAYVEGVSCGTLPSGTGFFYTFCVEPCVSAPSMAHAFLNYDADNHWTMTVNTGQVLSLGGAYLYAHWALGTLNGFDYDNAGDSEYKALRETIRGFTGAAAIDESSPFVPMLLSLTDDLSYWMQPYDPNALYEEIGRYCVFVMNNYNLDNEGGYQNLLYLSHASHAPEPATMVMLAMGALSMLRRRR